MKKGRNGENAQVQDSGDGFKLIRKEEKRDKLLDGSGNVSSNVMALNNENGGNEQRLGSKTRPLTHEKPTRRRQTQATENKNCRSKHRKSLFFSLIRLLARLPVH